MSAKGLEPLTNGLKGRCSTIELRALMAAENNIMPPPSRQHISDFSVFFVSSAYFPPFGPT